jgi:hypothetical protein
MDRFGGGMTRGNGTQMLTKGRPEREDYCLFFDCVRQAE